MIALIVISFLFSAAAVLYFMRRARRHARRYGTDMPQRFHRGFDAGITCRQDDLDAGRPYLVEQLHAAAVGQTQVRQDGVGHAPSQLQARFAQIAGRGGGETFDRNDFLQRRAGVFIVVNDQDVGHRRK